MNGRPLTEKQFQSAVVDLAAINGWSLRYHPLVSKGSTAGWPDWTLIRVPELLIVELKAERGRVSRAQQQWLDALAACGVETAVWRPGDWPAIEQRLARHYHERTA